jgi:hypothetical protein
MKAARDVDETDFRWLAYLRDRLGDRVANGIVIHFGERLLPFGDPSPRAGRSGVDVGPASVISPHSTHRCSIVRIRPG